MRSKLFSILLLVFLPIISLAQKMDEEDPHHHDHDHRFHIGGAISGIWLVNEKEPGLGIHLHYTYRIPKTRLDLGLAAEGIVAEHDHMTIGITGIYNLVGGLNINLSPGYSFEAFNISEGHLLLHIETSWEFDLNRIHLGPSLGYAFSREDNHLSLGLHVGYDL